MNGLKQLRREKMLTQQELADQVGVSIQAVQYWEAGSRSPRPAQQRKLCEVLGVTARELLAAIDEVASEGNGEAAIPGQSQQDQ